MLCACYVRYALRQTDDGQRGQRTHNRFDKAAGAGVERTELEEQSVETDGRVDGFVEIAAAEELVAKRTPANQREREREWNTERKLLRIASIDPVGLWGVNRRNANIGAYRKIRSGPRCINVTGVTNVFNCSIVE